MEKNIKVTGVKTDFVTMSGIKAMIVFNARGGIDKMMVKRFLDKAVGADEHKNAGGKDKRGYTGVKFTNPPPGFESEGGGGPGYGDSVFLGKKRKAL